MARDDDLKIEDDGKIQTVQYRQLFIVGSIGYLTDSLQKVAKKISIPRLEISPSIRQPGREFFATFQKEQPIVDLTIDRNPRNNEASIIAFSLGKPKTKNLVDKVSTQIGFNVKTPDTSLLQSMLEALQIEKLGLNAIDELQRATGYATEQVFAAVRYTNFLTQYWSMDKGAAMKSAGTRYGLMK